MQTHSTRSKGGKAGKLYRSRAVNVASKEHQMADNKNQNEKQPGENPEGKYHYNPGNQSGKEAEMVP